MLRATQSDERLDAQAPRSLGHSADPSRDLDQPYDRIRAIETDERDPDLASAIAPRRGVCVMHRIKSQLLLERTAESDDAALQWILTYERAIAKGEARACSCAVPS